MNQNILCENDFCIYQENKRCILEEIELDNAGICQSCILFNIEEKELKRKKKQTLQDIENRYK